MREAWSKARIVLLGVAIVGTLVGVMSASAGASVEGAAAIAYLNEQRAANGIPPVGDDQAFASAWCPAEDNGPSGGEIGRDLSPDASSWSPTSSPWDNAPLHQQDLYNPTYTKVGDVDVDGQACLGAGAPAPEPTTPTFAAFLSDRGPEHVPTTETIYGEGPFAPQQLVGIPLGKPTGGQIILYPEGLGEDPQALSWALTEEAGNEVRNVKLVGDSQAAAAGYPEYLVGVAIVIPPPLRANTKYGLTVEWEGSGILATQTLTFTTGPAQNRIRVFFKSGYIYGEDDARGATLTASRGKRRLRSTLTTRTSSGRYQGKISLRRLSPGGWQLCVSGGGGSSGYEFGHQCEGISVGRA
jgi:hypothetical protein